MPPSGQIGSRRGCLRLPAIREKLERFADEKLSRVERPQREQVVVVADQMAGSAIDRAEQEHDVVGIDGVVAKMEKGDQDLFAMSGDQADEFLDIVRWNSMLQQLLRILREGVGAVEELELAPALASQNFRVRTHRGCGPVGG